MKAKKKRTLPTIGWREWIALPQLGVDTIKVKVDTGARSSSIHAFNLSLFERGGVEWVRFEVHPVQRRKEPSITVEAKVLEHRSVRSSSGRAALRPVIITQASLLGVDWPIELTLASRDKMGFRMLLGREAIRNRFLIDPGRSFYGGRPVGRKRKKK